MESDTKPFSFDEMEDNKELVQQYIEASGNDLEQKELIGNCDDDSKAKEVESSSEEELGEDDRMEITYIHFKKIKITAKQTDGQSQQQDVKMEISNDQSEISNVDAVEECAALRSGSNKFNYLVDEYRCNFCDHVTTQRIYIEKHSRSVHMNEYNYKCKFCSYTSYRYGHMKLHIKWKHKKRRNEKKSLKCEHCSYRSSYLPDLTKHMREIHKKVLLFKCSSCDYSTFEQLRLISHVKENHSVQAAVTTSSHNPEHSSNDAVALRNDIGERMALIIGSKSKDETFKCEYCAFTTKYHGFLRSHLKRSHLNTKLFTCELCDFSSFDKCSMSFHVKINHIGGAANTTTQNSDAGGNTINPVALKEDIRKRMKIITAAISE